MLNDTWTHEQLAVINAGLDASIFLQGATGTGKTSAAVNRVLHLTLQGVPASSILILVPQRTLAQPYYQLVHAPTYPSGSSPEIITLGGLSQRLTSLFWPLIAKQCGFAHPNQPPSFLTLETAQYYLAKIAEPLINEGYFESLSLDTGRLLSQVLDNLNKAASVGFPYTEIADRLTSAWVGEKSQTRVYQDAQECANRFRAFCLQHNLIDFSLQLEIFQKHLWKSLLCREYLTARYRHLIYENIEEDIPITHDIIREWLPQLTSALLINDTESGFRSFLGADPESANSLQHACKQTITLKQSYISSRPLESFRESLTTFIERQSTPPIPDPAIRGTVHFTSYTFLPEMVDELSKQVHHLVTTGTAQPAEIAILSPFLSDSLRFSLMNRLEKLGIPCHSHRPSRGLQEEPATHCLLTLARLAHPRWQLRVSPLEFRSALMQSIANLDLVRADILARIVLRQQHEGQTLTSFDIINPAKQERITYSAGEKYEILRKWLIEYQSTDPVELDIFLSRLFGEVLSQPGFGFHDNFDSAGAASRLIESIQKFRWATANLNMADGQSLGLEYIKMVEQGIISAQYLQPWLDVPQDSVFIAPAYTFLMANRPVSIQFWLDIGSQGWWERLYQPLTHPIVLSRHWQTGLVWTDVHEFNANQQLLSRLTSGLIRRCRDQIFLCFLGINEQGREQRGLLLNALQNIQRRLPPDEGSNV